MSEKKKLIKSKRNLVYVLLVFLSLFLIVLIITILMQLGLIDNSLKNLNLTPRLFTIKDECSLIAGQLIHSINNEDSCEMRCKSECGVREMDFYSLDFTKKEADCHGCNCYCI